MLGLAAGCCQALISRYTATLLRLYPITLEPNHWYAPATLFVLSVIGGMALLGGWAAREQRLEAGA